MTNGIGANVERYGTDRAYARALQLTAVFALILGVVLRASIGADAPFWIDETATGVYASQPDMSSLITMARMDPNAPLYFVLAYAWAFVAGISDFALRIPSFAFALLAPLLALIPNPLIRREVRLIWCALLALWIPGLWYAQEARCYALLLCLAVGITIAYSRLLAEPTLGRAAVWTSLGALAILTHYYAALLVGLQGLVYVGEHHGRAARTWPAALAFVPVAIWISINFKTLRHYADPQFTWYPLVGADTWAFVAQFLIGSVGLTVQLALLMVLALLGHFLRFRPESAAAVPVSHELRIVIGTAAAAAALTIAIGMIRPTFTERYLMPCAPAILLGFAVIADGLNRRWKVGGFVMILLFGLAALDWARAGGPPHYKWGLSIEAASENLMSAGVAQFAFLWDNPSFPAVDTRLGSEMGGFFFRRAGRPVVVTVVQPNDHDDPNLQLLAAAAPHNSGLLWLYDLAVGRTAAIRHPPGIEIIDPSWTCRDFGAPPYGALACTRR